MKIINVFAAVLIASAVVLVLRWRRESYADAYQDLSGVIPAKIGIRSVISLDWKIGFREGCSGAVFEIDEITAASLEKEGLAFLDSAVQSRQHEGEYYTFERWQPTPMPGNFVDGNILTDGLACSSPSENIRRQIWRAAQAPGSYYANGPEKVLLIIPKSRVLVLAWVG